MWAHDNFLTIIIIIVVIDIILEGCFLVVMVNVMGLLGHQVNKDLKEITTVTINVTAF